VKLSFVIPSFQDERILETIESIKKIKAPKNAIEIIVQDGGSDKQLLNKIENLISANDKLIVENDHGIFDGINRGLKNTSGDLIATLGSDDRVFFLDYFLLLSKFKQGINFIQYDIEYTDSKWKPLRFWKARKLSLLRYAFGVQHAHFGLICSPEIYKELGYFNTENKVNADYEFFYKCTVSKSSLIIQDVIPDVFVQMKLGGNSSSNIRAVSKANIRIFKFILKTNPLLIFGLFLKPIYKLQEFLLSKLNLK
tara:strand:- start:1237 stop:1995 length:759 start_codon:yes stop_codon:yes gene_type:complete